MRTFSRTSQFKKDVKRGKNLAKLREAMDLLIAGATLSVEYRDHPLRGEFQGSRDCHVEPDWIHIYNLSEKDTHVRFERTGTHSDLFR